MSRDQVQRWLGQHIVELILLGVAWGVLTAALSGKAETRDLDGLRSEIHAMRAEMFSELQAIRVGQADQRALLCQHAAKDSYCTARP